MGFGLGGGEGGHEKRASARSGVSTGVVSTTVSVPPSNTTTITPSTVTSPNSTTLSSLQNGTTAAQTQRPLAIILTPSTLITALPLSKRDRVAWREERGEYEDALSVLGVHLPESGAFIVHEAEDGERVMEGNVNGYTNGGKEDDGVARGKGWVEKSSNEESWEEPDRRRIGRKYIELLLDEGSYEKAARIAGLILPSSSSSSLSEIRKRPNLHARTRTTDSEKDFRDREDSEGTSNASLNGDKENDREAKEVKMVHDAEAKKEWEEVVWMFAERDVLKVRCVIPVRMVLMTDDTDSDTIHPDVTRDAHRFISIWNDPGPFSE